MSLTMEQISLSIPNDSASLLPESTDSATFTVDEAIDLMGMGQFQWILFIITGMIYFSSGMYAKTFGIVSFENTILSVMSFIGGFVGGIIFGPLSDKNGRKKTIIICSVFAGFSVIWCTCTTNIYQKCIAKVFNGFFMPGVLIAKNLFAEYLPTNHRGKVLFYLQIFWTAGLLLSIVFVKYVVDYKYQLISIIPLWIATFVAIWKMPESVHHLVVVNEQNFQEQCVNILKEIGETNGTDLPEGELIFNEPIDKEDRGNINDLFCGDAGISALNTILLLLVISFCSFCYYGVTYASHEYFKYILYLHLHDETDELIIVLSEVSAIVLGYFLVNKGRALTMNIALFLYSMSTYLLVFTKCELNWLLGIILVYISRMFITLTWISGIIYLFEHYPTHLRATAYGLALSISNIIQYGAIAIGQELHIMIAMYIFGTLGIMAFVASLLLEIDESETWVLHEMV